MPIDFAAVAARFTALAATDRVANTAARAIEAALDRRLVTARAAEVVSRDRPVLRFEDGALVVRVVTAEPAAAGPGVGSWAAVPPAVRTGWDRWLRAATELPAFLAATDWLLGAADESITRYGRPTPDLFDPRGRTVFDLVGIGAAAYSALAQANEGGAVDRFLNQVATAALMVREAVPAPAPAGTGALSLPVAPAGAESTSDEPESVVLAAALVFAAVPRLLSTVLAGIDVFLRLQAVQLLAAVERRTRGAIAEVYQAVFDALRGMGLGLLQLVRGIQVVVGRFARAATSFAVGVGGAFGRAVRDFVYQLARFLQAVVGLVELVVELLQVLGLDAWTGVPEAPRLAFTPLPDFGTTLFGPPVRRQVTDAVAGVDEAVRGSLRDGFSRTADGLAAAAADFHRLADVHTEPFPFPPRPAVDSEALTATLLPREPVPAHRDPLATEVDLAVAQQWMGAGAVGSLAAVLDGYARQVAAQWQARQRGAEPRPELAPGTPTPTSPHLLRRRAMPARVRVPRMLVRVGEPADDDTLRAVAAEIAGAVRDAYRRGAPLAGTGGGW